MNEEMYIELLVYGKVSINNHLLLLIIRWFFTIFSYVIVRSKVLEAVPELASGERF